jgi:hypothetical protein
MATKLSDDEVYDRIHAALLALGKQDGESIVGYTGMETARQALTALQIGLLMAIENGSDDNGAIISPSRPHEP